MARYADVDKLIWQVQNNDKYGTITKQVFISLLQNSEMEDVAPVVHAHWIKRSNPNYSPFDGSVEYDKICSNCGCYNECFDNYCPDCGAKMDEEV